MPHDPSQQSSRLRRREARNGNYSLELPISKQFTPEQIRSIGEFLRIVSEHGPENEGSNAQARARLKERFFAAARRGGTQEKRLKQAGNAMMSARHWGLLDNDGTLTDVGRAALATGEEQAAVRTMVQHFLHNLGGTRTANAILDIIRSNDGIAPEKTGLAASLRGMGIYENADGTDHSAVLAWLAHPGAQVVVRRGRGRWELDEQRFPALAGSRPPMWIRSRDAIRCRSPCWSSLRVPRVGARTPGPCSVC
jgi:hypothetical protein